MSGLGQVLSGKVNLPINAHQTVVLKYAVSDILRGRAGFQIWNTRFQPSALIYSSHWDRNKCLIMMNAIWMLLLTGTLVGTISAGLLGVYMLRPYKFFNVIEGLTRSGNKSGSQTQPQRWGEHLYQVFEPGIFGTKTYQYTNYTAVWRFAVYGLMALAVSQLSYLMPSLIVTRWAAHAIMYCYGLIDRAMPEQSKRYPLFLGVILSAAAFLTAQVHLTGLLFNHQMAQLVATLIGLSSLRLHGDIRNVLGRVTIVAAVYVALTSGIGFGFCVLVTLATMGLIRLPGLSTLEQTNAKVDIESQKEQEISERQAEDLLKELVSGPFMQDQVIENHHIQALSHHLEHLLETHEYEIAKLLDQTKRCTGSALDSLTAVLSRNPNAYELYASRIWHKQSQGKQWQSPTSNSVHSSSLQIGRHPHYEQHQSCLNQKDNKSQLLTRNESCGVVMSSSIVITSEKSQDPRTDDNISSLCESMSSTLLKLTEPKPLSQRLLDWKSYLPQNLRRQLQTVQLFAGIQIPISTDTGFCLTSFVFEQKLNHYWRIAQSILNGQWGSFNGRGLSLNKSQQILCDEMIQFIEDFYISQGVINEYGVVPSHDSTGISNEIPLCQRAMIYTTNCALAVLLDDISSTNRSKLKMQHRHRLPDLQKQVLISIIDDLEPESCYGLHDDEYDEQFPAEQAWQLLDLSQRWYVTNEPHHHRAFNKDITSIFEKLPNKTNRKSSYRWDHNKEEHIASSLISLLTCYALNRLTRIKPLDISRAPNSHRGSDIFYIARQGDESFAFFSRVGRPSLLKDFTKLIENTNDAGQLFQEAILLEIAYTVKCEKGVYHANMLEVGQYSKSTVTRWPIDDLTELVTGKGNASLFRYAIDSVCDAVKQTTLWAFLDNHLDYEHIYASQYLAQSLDATTTERMNKVKTLCCINTVARHIESYDDDTLSTLMVLCSESATGSPGQSSSRQTAEDEMYLGNSAWTYLCSRILEQLLKKGRCEDYLSTNPRRVSDWSDDPSQIAVVRKALGLNPFVVNILMSTLYTKNKFSSKVVFNDDSISKEFGIVRAALADWDKYTNVWDKESAESLINKLMAVKPDQSYHKCMKTYLVGSGIYARKVEMVKHSLKNTSFSEEPSPAYCDAIDFVTQKIMKDSWVMACTSYYGSRIDVGDVRRQECDERSSIIQMVFDSTKKEDKPLHPQWELAVSKWIEHCLASSASIAAHRSSKSTRWFAEYKELMKIITMLNDYYDPDFQNRAPAPIKAVFKHLPSHSRIK